MNQNGSMLTGNDMLNRNPHAEQMASAAMERSLDVQARAIWPQERLLFARYRLPEQCRIADIGCGTGEISARLAAVYGSAEILGVDVLESMVSCAGRRHTFLAPRVRFRQGDAFDLNLPSGHYDLVVCRHMTQCVPQPERVLSELSRICKSGGWIHVLSEDYGMVHVTPGRLDADRFWHRGPIVHAQNTGTDARIGRRTWTLLRRLDMEDLRVDYVTLDTLRVPREIFASVMEAWRDGYVEAVSAHCELTYSEVREYFDYIVECIRSPDEYVVWQLPIVSGRKP